MNLLDHIGLAVTGCKNGYAIFGSAGAIATPDAEASRAMRDMRSYLRISEPRGEFYSMEYLDHFIVYSKYRSSIDSVGSTGAYIAVHLFVPYNVVCSGMTGVLGSLLDLYWDEFMHPMFGSPLPGKIENISRLVGVLEQMSGHFHLVRARYAHGNSDPSQLPVYIACSSPEEVDKIMANPIHAAYYRGSRLILVPAAMIDAPQAHATTFNTAVQTILPQHGRAEGLIGAISLPAGLNLRLTALSIDGVDVLSSGEDFSAEPDSTLSYTLNMPGRKNFKYTGTVQEALHNKMLRKQGSNYEIAPVLVQVNANVVGTITPDLMPVLISASGRDYRIKNLPGGGAGWLVPSDGFPYSLAVDTPKEQHTVKDNFVTVASFSSAPYTIDMAELREAAGANRPPELSANDDSLIEKSNRTMLIAIAGAVLAAVAAFAVWWFFIREPEAEVVEPEKEEVVVPDSTLLTIDPALLPDANMQWIDIAADSITASAKMLNFAPGQPLKLRLLNKAWKQGDRTLGDSISIYFLDKNGKTLHTLVLTAANIDSMANLRLYPKNTLSSYLAHPAAPAEQPTPAAQGAEQKTNAPAAPAPRQNNTSIIEGAIGNDPDPRSEQLQEQPQLTSAQRQAIKRMEQSPEVKALIQELNTQPSSDVIKKANEYMKNNGNGNIPSLSTAVENAKKILRSQQTNNTNSRKR